MNPVLLIHQLAERGVVLTARLRIDSPTNAITLDERQLLAQWKPLLIRALIELEGQPPSEICKKEATKPSLLLDGGIDCSMEITSAKQLRSTPLQCSSKLIMVDKTGKVITRITECYMWTRQQLGYGWWYASDFPPPLT